MGIKYIHKQFMMDDLDIYLIKSTYEQVKVSSSRKNNVEIIEYTVPKGESGLYRYEVDVYNLYSGPVHAYVTWLKWRPGDVNGDGITNSLDASIILQYTPNSTSTPEQLFVADVNKDGVVNSLDASAILQYDSNFDIVLQ
ncbi:MAG: hypothetical protein E7597_00415 [Ruminococcaceae bacterium]|nr:hypothetical protein [Oscillospiraceae bacterium]